jgi:Obg family GTPase CgtA-like protein
LEKKGVVAALKKAGAEPGDEIRIGEVEFEYQ